MASLGHLQIGERELQAARAAALRLDDRRQLLHRLLHVTVDDEIIVLPPQRNFLPGARQAAADLRFGVGAALAQALFELLHGWRHDEHEHRLRVARPELRRPLRVDVEQDVAAPSERLLQRPRPRAVEVTMHGRPLGELAARAAWLTSRSSPFEAIVLTSRPSSWIRKSSGRPTTSPVSSTCANSARCARSRVSSSRTSVFSAQTATSLRIRPSSIVASPRSARIRSRSRSARRAAAAGARASTRSTWARWSAVSAWSSTPSASPSVARRA